MSLALITANYSSLDDGKSNEANVFQNGELLIKNYEVAKSSSLVNCIKSFENRKCRRAKLAALGQLKLNCKVAKRKRRSSGKGHVSPTNKNVQNPDDEVELITAENVKEAMPKLLSKSLPFVHCKIVFNFEDEDENQTDNRSRWEYTNDKFIYHDSITTQERMDLLWELEDEDDYESEYSDEDNLFSPAKISDITPEIIVSTETANNMAKKESQDSPLITKKILDPVPHKEKESATIKIRSLSSDRKSKEITKNAKPLFKQNMKSFKCNTCSKVFKYNSGLQSHLVCHRNERPFKCCKCPMNFKRKTNSNQHLKRCSNSQHIHGSICLKNFSSKSLPEKHEMSYSKLKPFPCTFCFKSFRTRNQLENHIRSHTGEQPFKCPYCCKWFSQATNQLRHMKNTCKLSK